MIAEIIPQIYDAAGRPVSEPFRHRKGPHPTFPMGRYVSQRVTVKCNTISDIRRFLLRCKYVSDKELFDKDDYWQPPEEFEAREKGDCEDFALWTWRQLLSMGYEARFIGGSCGRYGVGHAWVEFQKDGKWFLLEPLRCRLGETMPRLSTFRYEPKLSVWWDGKKLKYFSHKKPEVQLGWKSLSPLICEYLMFWLWFWIRNFYLLPQVLWNAVRRHVFKRKLWSISRTWQRLN